MEHANRARDMYGRQTVLFLDEIHRFTKAQQDALLPGRREPPGRPRRGDDREPVVLASSRRCCPARCSSRSVPLTDDDVADVLAAAVADERGLAGGLRRCDDDARDHLVRLAGGDARRALTSLEAAAGVAEDALAAGRRATGRRCRSPWRRREQAVAHAAVRYDRTGDQHYDVASRAHQVDARLRRRRGAALPRPDARGGGGPPVHRPADRHRGLARTSAWPTRPRCRPPSPRCTRSPRSACPRRGSSWPRRSSTTPWRRSPTPPTSASTRPSPTSAPAAAARCPPHLRGSGYAGAARLGHGEGYVYAHDEPDGVAAQQYLPDDLAGRDRLLPADATAASRRGCRPAVDVAQEPPRARFLTP